MERRNRTNVKQFHTLISELEKKPSLARGVHRGATHVYAFRQDWEKITIKLNAQGPPIRNCDGWLRVWRDFKFKLRKKLFHMEAAKSGTAKGEVKNIILYPLEQAAAKLICPEDQFSNVITDLEFQPAIEKIKSESVDEAMWEEEERCHSESQSVVEEIKTEDYGMMDHTLLVEEESLPSTSTNTFQIQMLESPERKKRKRVRKCDQRQELLEKHNDMQEKVFTEISNSMKELENIFRDSTQHQQKLLEVQEKKLQIIQRQHDREEKLFKSEIKLKMLEMKMKTKELEALEKQSKS